MNKLIFKLYVKFQDLKNNEDGQDLVEYGLVVAIVAFGATAGMGILATGLSGMFTQINAALTVV